jgi:hypothetical protein
VLSRRSGRRSAISQSPHSAFRSALSTLPQKALDKLGFMAPDGSVATLQVPQGCGHR